MSKLTGTRLGPNMDPNPTSFANLSINLLVQGIFKRPERWTAEIMLYNVVITTLHESYLYEFLRCSKL